MTSAHRVAEYRRLREESAWKLLAADSGPLILGLLESRFPPGERLIASAAVESLNFDLDELRAQGESVPTTAQACLSDWVSKGYLERRLLPGESEESYELSPSATTVIAFASSLIAPRSSATESRLSTVLLQVRRLAEESEVNRESRLKTLRAEVSELEEKIHTVEVSGVVPLDPRRAIERTREIIALSSDLLSDFTRVRADFEALNRNLRQHLAEGSEHRGGVLERLFADIDLIAESDSGRSFDAFWRMLMDRRQRGLLDDSMDAILSRDFVSDLEEEEVQFLRSLGDTLLDRGGTVHFTQERFARSLRDFVRSRDFLEQRRLGELLRQAHLAALSATNSAGPRARVALLDLSGASIRSFDQWVLKDPALGYEPRQVRTAEALDVDMSVVATEVLLAEIDFRRLRENIRSYLAETPQASIADLVDRYGTAQGLGTILGYLDIAYKCAELTPSFEEVSWTGSDGIPRGARIPRVFFIKERVDELD